MKNTLYTAFLITAFILSGVELYNRILKGQWNV